MGYQKYRGMWDMGFIPRPKKLVLTFFYQILKKRYVANSIYFKNLSRTDIYQK